MGASGRMTHFTVIKERDGRHRIVASQLKEEFDVYIC
jgi:hypothetical protein